MPQKNINYSNHKLLRKINDLDCETAIIMSDILLKKIVKKLHKINDFENTDDYKRYNLYPGQQVRTLARGYIPHAGIYLFNGLLIEMGYGPKNCKLKVKSNITFFSPIYNQIAAFSSVEKFIHESKKSKVGYNKIITKKDNDPEEIHKRIDRIVEVFGPRRYNLYTDNCLHLANYVTNGNKNYFYIIRDNRNKIKMKSNIKSIRRRSIRRRSIRKLY
jgi:hypothetical protein